MSAAFILASAAGVNAILGLIKSRRLAHFFGISNELAIFYTADRIPNLIYSVLIMGAISTVFIPIFTARLKKDKEKAFKTASAISIATMLIFVVLASLIFFFSPSIINIISVGKFSQEEVILGSNLMRIMLVAQMVLVVGSLTTSILQSFKYFLLPAFAPVAYNLGMLLGIEFLSEKYGIYGPAIGVVAGAILHVCIQLPALRKTEFSLDLNLNFSDKGLRNLFKLVPPRVFSVLLSHLVDTINNSLAILVSASSVVLLKFATQLQTFPVTLFGISIAVASLPTLSNESEEESLDKFKQTFTTSFLQMMFLVLPISMILLVLRIPVVRLVYGVSNFPWEATIKTSYALAFFSISIFAQSSYHLLTRAFYALKNTKTQVIISLLTIVTNVILSAIFVVVLKFGVWSIALAYSITSMMDFILLFYYLDKRVGGFDKKKLIIPFVKISYATLIMGIMLYVPLKFLDKYIFDTTRTLSLLLVTAIASGIGLAAYLALTKLFKVAEIQLLYKLARKFEFKKEKMPVL